METLSRTKVPVFDIAETKSPNVVRTEIMDASDTEIANQSSGQLSSEVDPVVAEFLLRYGVGREEEAKHNPNGSATIGSDQCIDDTMVTPSAKSTAESTVEWPAEPVRSQESRHAIHELRSVAGSISEVVLKSHTLKLLREARKQLALSSTMTVGSVIIGLMSTSIISFPFALAIGLLLAGMVFGLRFNSSLQRCRTFVQAD